MSKQKHKDTDTDTDTDEAKALSLGDLDLTRKLDEHDYLEAIDKLEKRFEAIQQAYLHTGDNAVVVFEGWDAAGKGGAIRRMVSRMDPRGFHVWPIAAPKPEEKALHYLTRFWARLPPKGQIAIFDRSWYGRVLVERVEGFASRDEWQRAYGEINAFEAMLADSGTKIAKIFLYIDADEQLQRFGKRLKDPMKRWKLSFEDFRNRDRWDEYVAAADAMLQRTNRPDAPWTLVPANDKKYARVAALTAIADRLSEGVDLSPRPLDPALEKAYRREVDGH
ncbi:polyphosphate kinase [Aurantimonas sp. Leaf443]|uniref:polyphosphate kinase 2 family protein n=1 Tax=Aurantimonas sp. Leaf443 TaxID=1736378 RepID=UPI0006FE2D80|nr:polyphosphate kinase [Aurantimonas sp. Leaf443]KQT82184.1 polyphosphate kinase [Aurantimonas sp. Leaf443]